MTGTIPVVFEADTYDEAYAMGFERFEDADEPQGDAGDVEDDIAMALDGFQQGAAYTNTVLPRLRCMAGYGDAGHGTYQQGRQVAFVEVGDGDDRPIEAEHIQSHHIFDELVDLFANGAYDALHPDRERGDANEV